MKGLLVLAWTCFALGCAEKVNRTDLDHLNGYWEIERVAFPDGSHREYGINTSVDFMFWDGEKGYRKKVQPNLNGTYSTSDDAAFFKIAENRGVFMIRYNNGMSEWEEQIEFISNSELIVVNEENIRYHYKRFQPGNFQK
ncbi:MAG TPA: hypothetical protein VKN36_15670 [Eudoraea sp.]|nr:hypothetical protein [Eudoraea sp.]